MQLKTIGLQPIVLRAFSLSGLSGIGSGGCEEKLNLFDSQAGQAGGLKSCEGFINISRGGTVFESYITISISL